MFTPIQPHRTETGRGGRTHPGQGRLPPPSSAPLPSQPGGCARGRRLSPEREPGVSAPLPDSCRYRYTRKFTSSLVTLILASPRSDGVLTTRRPPPAGEGTGESKSTVTHCPGRSPPVRCPTRWTETPPHTPPHGATPRRPPTPAPRCGAWSPPGHVNTLPLQKQTNPYILVKRFPQNKTRGCISQGCKSIGYKAHEKKKIDTFQSEQKIKTKPDFSFGKNRVRVTVAKSLKTGSVVTDPRGPR